MPADYGMDLWNNSDIIWTTTNDTGKDFWENQGILDIPSGNGNGFATPRPGIQCLPAPGPFLPCNDLFDWWTLRCSVWIVFLLALLGKSIIIRSYCHVLSPNRGCFQLNLRWLLTTCSH